MTAPTSSLSAFYSLSQCVSIKKSLERSEYHIEFQQIKIPDNDYSYLKNVRNTSVYMDENQSFSFISKLLGLLNQNYKRRILEQLVEIVQLEHFQSLRLASHLHSDCYDNCFDFVSWLPQELVFQIFSYLQPECLINASRVNHAWNRASHQPKLFQRLCSLQEWSMPNLDTAFPPPTESRVTTKTFFPTTNFPIHQANVSSTNHKQERLSSLSNTNRLSLSQSDVDNDKEDWYKKFKWRYQVRKNWSSGKHRVRRFEGHTGAVHCLAYDAYRIVSGSADSTICVWKVCSNANWLAQTLRGHSGAVRCLKLLPLPAYLVTTSSSVSSSPTTSSPSQGEWSPSVWEPPEALLISGSLDTTLKLWRLSSTYEWSRITCISTLQGHMDTVRCVQADEEKVISGSYDCTLRLWDLATSQQKLIFHGHTGGVVCLIYDSSSLYSGSLDNTVRVWDLKTAVCYHTLVRPGSRPGAEFWTTPVTSLHLDTSRSRLFVAHHDGKICIWKIPTTTNHDKPHLVDRLQVDGDSSTGAVIRCLAGDSWHLLCGCDDQTIKVWRADTNALIGCLRGHEDGVTCLLIYGSVVISGSYDKNILLYDFDIN